MKKETHNFVKDIKELKEIVSDHLPTWKFADEMEKSMICISYYDTYGIEDFKAFIQFCKENNREDIITLTIAHDLNGTYKEYFLPRTSGYYKRTQKGA